MIYDLYVNNIYIILRLCIEYRQFNFYFFTDYFLKHQERDYEYVLYFSTYNVREKGPTTVK